VDKNLEARLKAHVNFPSPPGVAQQIILVANDPDAELAAVAEIVSRDPGLTVKILKIANSPLYARRRKSDNLRQALMVLGLRATTTLALSFSIAPMFRRNAATGLDYARCWRRALMSAIAAQTFGELVGLHRPEDLFLAGLMQDVAMLALDRTKADFYSELASDAPHADICLYEQERLGADHAAVGEMLLRHWHLPAFLCEAIAASHAADTTDRSSESGLFIRCVALGGAVADCSLNAKRGPGLLQLESRAGELLGLDGPRVGEAMTTVMRLVPEIEQLFDTRLMDPSDAQSLMDQARDLLTIRSLESLEQVSSLQSRADELEERTARLQDDGRRDALTGAFNRGYLETALAAEFSNAVASHCPLCIIFIDLDYFKRVNDTYGHPAGDAVLRSTAKVVSTLVRKTDFVARYGGEEFVIVLPGLGSADAHAMCARINTALRQTSHEFAGQKITVTASLGLAVHTDAAPFPTVEDMVKAADEAVYSAKRAGRDRFICHTRLREAG
jgi:diguanylate cyclase (GGDEF)-like protein